MFCFDPSNNTEEGVEGSGEEEEHGVLLVLEGELIILFDEINVDAEMYDFAARDASHLRTQHVYMKQESYIGIA